MAGAIFGDNAVALFVAGPVFGEIWVDSPLALHTKCVARPRGCRRQNAKTRKPNAKTKHENTKTRKRENGKTRKRENAETRKSENAKIEHVPRSTWNTKVITALGMCKVCTEPVHSVALGTRTLSQLWACVKYVPKQSIP